MKRASKIIAILICVLIFTACGAKATNQSFADTDKETENSASTEDAVEDTQPKLPETVVALEEAKEDNTDSVAWLRIPGTNIDNPVMQSSDNSYYLKRDETGKYNQWGCYFADYYSVLIDRSSLQQNTVIYGHSQNNDSPNGKKFSQLFHYLDIDFLQENPNIYLTIGDEEMTFEVFAVFITDIDFYYINPSPSDEGFSDFAQTVAAKNEYIFDSKFTEQDKLLTLSACSHQYDVNNTGNQRIVIMAKLLPEGVTSSSVSVCTNPNPERP